MNINGVRTQGVANIYASNGAVGGFIFSLIVKSENKRKHN